MSLIRPHCSQNMGSEEYSENDEKYLPRTGESLTPFHIPGSDQKHPDSISMPLFEELVLLRFIKKDIVVTKGFRLESHC